MLAGFRVVENRKATLGNLALRSKAPISGFHLTPYRAGYGAVSASF